ncbi:hypothetical protein FBY51_1805 [Zymomonas mobilis]|uniref:hypothetical protein n=1 Tax=Zymomonas mobilis TaxID=542 RepID=UPI00026D81FB|nr:hypothetical protein [Zymomonas mobilis]AFN57584.1 hypothetical protein ZZ6_1733 [Zymomonas mobilis subsp. mobilis ATCC 29191]TQK74398.1 hypothetical protein FBY53_1824 [Zymomonas mobilis]TQL14635.1 hypothetical protein FBY51_1805 [Zymomonas mobilis]GEB88301.1 hypothetical protein ZMO01_16410 [Zymomonas mobilis subsp. mobilis]
MDDFFNEERFERWVKVSVGLDRFNKHLPSILLGLSVMDIDLYKKDLELVEKYKEGGDATKDYGSESESVSGSLKRHLTYSYLWVLGAYEFVRTITLSIKDRKDEDFKDKEVFEKLTKTKNLFTRLRVPLAKLEAARYHEKTDFMIAYPGIDCDVGIAWQVNENLVISRQKLSDLFLETLEFMRSRKWSRVPNEDSLQSA